MFVADFCLIFNKIFNEISKYTEKKTFLRVINYDISPKIMKFHVKMQVTLFAKKNDISCNVIFVFGDSLFR